MKHSFMCCILVMLMGSTPVFCTELTKAEREAGSESLEILKKDLATADKEEKRLYKTLKEDKKFFAIWSRAKVDPKNPDKLKALIRVARKAKLWGTVSWLLEDLAKFIEEKPTYYRLSALAKHEQGIIDEARESAHVGTIFYPYHRGLRRLWFHLYGIENKFAERPLISSLERFIFVVDSELCHRRSAKMKGLLQDAIYGDGLPIVMQLELDPYKNMKTWENYLKGMKRLRHDHDFDHKCQYVAAIDKLGREVISCFDHAHSRCTEIDKKWAMPLQHYRVAADVIKKALRHHDSHYSAKAVQCLAMRPHRLSEEEERQICSLLKDRRYRETDVSRLLAGILFYLRRYEARPFLKKQLSKMKNTLYGWNKAVLYVVLSWCGEKKPNRLSSDVIKAYGLIDLEKEIVDKLPGRGTDVNKFATEVIIDMGEEAFETMRAYCYEADHSSKVFKDLSEGEFKEYYLKRTRELYEREQKKKKEK